MSIAWVSQILNKHPSKNPTGDVENVYLFLRSTIMFYFYEGISALSLHELNNRLPILLREADVKPSPFDNIS